FTVYDDGAHIDREWPFDIVPRLILKREWDEVARGLKQRVRALNAFIDDVYHHRRALRDGVVPADYVLKSREYRSRCVGISPPHGVWAHVCGSDLVRDADGKLYVLEDNLRVPSGVSYMLENRAVMKRVFPELFEHYVIHPVDDYPARLAACLRSISPREGRSPRIVVLTPGIYNSAYFEHAYLAQEMAADLVEGPDLVVADDDCVYMKTIDGLVRVDVIYRRIDDHFLDPVVFNAQSTLGVPGLMAAARAGTVSIANSVGNGVGDDKAVYAYVPDMIRYYLGEEPIIPNADTYLLWEQDQRNEVLERLDQLVVKPVAESGGYGIVIGPKATDAELAEARSKILDDPRNWIAQEVVNLSRLPAWAGDSFAPRHIDLRPFVLCGEQVEVIPGGLTRVALREGSLIVNSSQGGGSKDTWVLGNTEQPASADQS
ncbi:MAG: circularly permuted type 2 ATP-grasp protein, partial [Spirochaetaceae bacterium]|nr:circularly permuted type 2 ATP-grasp protein [Spirochaetaceae bacterium]